MQCSNSGYLNKYEIFLNSVKKTLETFPDYNFLMIRLDFSTEDQPLQLKMSTIIFFAIKFRIKDVQDY